MISSCDICFNNTRAKVLQEGGGREAAPSVSLPIPCLERMRFYLCRRFNEEIMGRFYAYGYFFFYLDSEVKAGSGARK